MIPRIRVDSTNWKDYWGEVSTGGYTIIGCEPEGRMNLIVTDLTGAPRETSFVEIEDPCYVALSNHEGKRMCLNCWDEGEYFSPDEVEDGTLWGFDENGERFGVDREYLSKLILWRGE